MPTWSDCWRWKFWQLLNQWTWMLTRFELKWGIIRAFIWKLNKLNQLYLYSIVLSALNYSLQRSSKSNREFKLHVSGNGKRQVRTFFAKFSLNVFVSHFLSCVERIIMYFSFKTASSFTLYCLIRLTYNAKLKLSIFSSVNTTGRTPCGG
jgi:hypothetical protein